MGFIYNHVSSVLINEWLNCMLDYEINSDSPCDGNFPEFKEHRWEQSIMSILAIKYDLNTFNDPVDLFGESHILC